MVECTCTVIPRISNTGALCIDRVKCPLCKAAGEMALCLRRMIATEVIKRKWPGLYNEFKALLAEAKGEKV